MFFFAIFSSCRTCLNPKVQASVQANTWVWYWSDKNTYQIGLQDILPSIFNQQDNLDLMKLAAQLQKRKGKDANAGAVPTTQNDDDDDIPDLVPGETFEAAAEEVKPTEEKVAA